ncbi:hypothetical protein [Melaminivora sp.]|uniref:hypothetical protein n=1 Tax=Melaminivora sp. TaxID=1933032 RepID=UPI0028A76D46|nr:hypothetical protein [Melaminivora sp.]
MTYRTAAGLRLQPVLAANLKQAWERAFDVLERLGCNACGCGLRKLKGGAA